jgi:hypothetical protein
MRLAAALLVSLLVCHAPSAVAIQTKNTPLNPETVAGDLVSARDEVYARVVDLKKTLATNPQELAKAKLLYLAAKKEYTGWTATLHLAIFRGSVKNLRNDPDYTAKTAAAKKASAEFVRYADAQTAPKGFFAFVSDAATIGIRIWNAVKDRHEKERLAFLAEFDKLVKWDDWDAIGGQKPAATAPGH